MRWIDWRALLQDGPFIVVVLVHEERNESGSSAASARARQQANLITGFRDTCLTASANSITTQNFLNSSIERAGQQVPI